jgi:hypothetical protein
MWTLGMYVQYVQLYNVEGSVFAEKLETLLLSAYIY